ncbi:hypothetical protein G4O51_03100 [Candidatus Bathyarchaeota archaeon A05DMB-2]|jgi:hypothetical protein|nr:hypothetical protein [Candidatus Bathyarchaeota archaeon A05DMB-2]
MGSVSAEDVRDALNVKDSDISDAKVLKMIKRAEVTLELELSAGIDYQNCSEAQKEAITLLAAIYAVCYLTGGSAIGLNFSVGDLTNSTASLPSLAVLQAEFERVLSSLKEPYVGSV